MPLLDAEQLELVHEGALELLEEIGVELMAPAARAVFAAAGALVDHETGLTRIPRALVEHAVASAPARFTVSPRNPARALDVEIGRAHV